MGTSLVPISDRRGLATFTKVIDQLPHKLPASVGHFQNPMNVLDGFDWKVYSSFCKQWTSDVRPAQLRFEQLDWQTKVVSQSGEATLCFILQEDTFAAIIATNRINAYHIGAATMQFRVDSDDIRSVEVYISPPPRSSIDLSQADTIMLSRYMMNGRRLAINLMIPNGGGQFVQTFNIDGFEYANFDALRRFVF